MCIIITLPVGTTISNEEFKNAWDGNPDGAGYAFVNDDDKLVVHKGMHFKKFKHAFDRDFQKFHERTPFLLHFRIATHGGKCVENCHPFFVNDDMVMAHNGVISIDIPRGDKRSDTRVFNDEVLKKLPKGWLSEPTYIDLVEKSISGSKIALLTRSRELHILNQSDGYDLEDGRWVSNKSLEHPPYLFKYYSGGKYTPGSSIMGGDDWGEDPWWKSYMYHDDNSAAEVADAYVKGKVEACKMCDHLVDVNEPTMKAMSWCFDCTTKAWEYLDPMVQDMIQDEFMWSEKDSEAFVETIYG